MNKEIVIAAYDRDLSWTSKLNSNIKITVYRKGNKIHNINEIPLSNKGRCVHTFFNHIYSNYENLSDVTCFVQDYPFDHWENVINLLNDGIEAIKTHATLKIGGYYGFHYNTIKIPSDKGGIMWDMYDSNHFTNGKVLTCNSNGTPQADPSVYPMNLDEFWYTIFDVKHPKYYEFIPGGHFVITKEHAKLRSKSFYKNIVDILESDSDSPWIIERLECYIFNPKYKTKI